MKFATAIVLACVCVGGFRFPVHAQDEATSHPPVETAPKPQPRSVWDGVYTTAQAKRGSAHVEQCQPCHGPDLKGDSEPPLIGPGFTTMWDGKTLGDLFEIVLINFDGTFRVKPSDDPLSHQKAVDFVAYLLSQNQFPAGDTEVPADLPAMRQIRLQASHP